MEIREVIQSQYLAALEMLEQAIQHCPDALWDHPGDKNRFWHLSYHALFYTHLYLQNSEKEFSPWSKHRERYHSLEPLPQPPYDEPQIRDSYSKEEVLEYHRIVQEQVVEKIATLDLNGPSGFYWLPFSKAELLLYNLRHIQQHTGELCERLGTQVNIDVEWVGTKAGI